MATETLESIKKERDSLRITIEDIDNFSQTGFSRIAAVAQMALLAMESPKGASLDEIAEVLQLIKYTAEDMENTINGEAESVGCNYVDKAQRRRWDATQATH